MNTVERHAAHPVPPSEANGAPERRQDPARDAGLPTRPDHNLLVYYALQSLLLGPFFWAMLIPYYFRYRSLRYEFDAEGVGMSWGILFRKEISLTYARIQDIHLTSNVVERWLGLARIEVQTASGSASAEMTIEGLREFEQIRDLLYARMRGARGEVRGSDRPAISDPEGLAVARVGSIEGVSEEDELPRTLLAVAAELRALRETIEAGRGRTDV
jgi:membrane protein YdbS with pleckstrin-like domain